MMRWRRDEEADVDVDVDVGGEELPIGDAGEDLGREFGDAG